MQIFNVNVTLSGRNASPNASYYHAQFATVSGAKSSENVTPVAPPRKSADAPHYSGQKAVLGTSNRPESTQVSHFSACVSQLKTVNNNPANNNATLDAATKQYVESNFNLGGATKPVEEFQLPEANSDFSSMQISSGLSKAVSNAPLLPEALPPSQPSQPSHSRSPQTNVTEVLQSQSSNSRKLGKLKDGMSTFLTIKDFR